MKYCFNKQYIHNKFNNIYNYTKIVFDYYNI